MFQSGECVMDGGRAGVSEYTIEHPEALECPVCERAFGHFAALQKHVTTHARPCEVITYYTQDRLLTKPKKSDKND